MPGPVKRTPRNTESYTPRRVLARDRPYDTSRTNNDDHDRDHDHDHIPTHGILPEQYKSNRKLRPSERRNSVQARTVGRGWSCPIHVCFRPLGEIEPPSIKKHSNNSNNKEELDGAELVALRLQDAQSMFSGEEIKKHANNKQPLTQLGRFHFHVWKPTFHATATPRHVDETLYHSLKRSKARVNHAKVCGGGGSRLQNDRKSPPPMVALTQQDFEQAFANSNSNSNSNSNNNAGTAGTAVAAAGTFQQPTRPAPSTVIKFGHEVMSPRVSKLLRDGHEEQVKMASRIYLPYTSRTPRSFPLQLPSYKEFPAFVKRGGNQFGSVENGMGGSSSSSSNNSGIGIGSSSSSGNQDGEEPKSGEDQEEMKRRKNEVSARRNFEKFYPMTPNGQVLFKDEESRRKTSKAFYQSKWGVDEKSREQLRGWTRETREFEIATPRKYKRGRTTRKVVEGNNGRRNRKNRPPTPGLPRKKINRPAER